MLLYTRLHQYWHQRCQPKVSFSKNININVQGTRAGESLYMFVPCLEAMLLHRHSYQRHVSSAREKKRITCSCRSSNHVVWRTNAVFHMYWHHDHSLRNYSAAYTPVGLYNSICIVHVFSLLFLTLWIASVAVTFGSGHSHVRHQWFASPCAFDSTINHVIASELPTPSKITRSHQHSVYSSPLRDRRVRPASHAWRLGSKIHATQIETAAPERRATHSYTLFQCRSSLSGLTSRKRRIHRGILWPP